MSKITENPQRLKLQLCLCAPYYQHTGIAVSNSAFENEDCENRSRAGKPIRPFPID